jgi:very-short-patch-repair endonuclease
MENESPVHQITRYLQTLDGLPPRVVRVEGCFIVLACPMCGQEYKKKQSLLTYAARQGNQTGLTCSRFCGTKRRATLYPEVFKLVGEKLKGRVATGKRGRGVPREPHTEAHRAHLSAKAKEIRLRPKIRGGNGTGMTASESLLWPFLEPLGVVWNFPVSLGVRQEGYPTNYKLDFAHPQLQIGLEVDGPSHRMVERKAQDAKKVAKLESLGWTVYRISNEKAQKLFGTSRLKDAPITSLKEFLSIIASG